MAAFRTHTDLRHLGAFAKVFAVEQALSPEECARIVELGELLGTTRATQSRDPGLNRVLRLPVNGTRGPLAARLELLELAFRIHGLAVAHAQSAYPLANVAPPPVWKALPRATDHERFLANVGEWNRRVKFNMNVLRYTTDGGNVGTTFHRDESPLAFVVPLAKRNAAGGGTLYAHLPAPGQPRTLDPPPGTLVLHPGDATHRGVPIRARDATKGPGERWILAGFLGTAPRLPPPAPEPPLDTRAGDAEALQLRWGLPPRGCHVAGKPRYTKADGTTSDLRRGSRSPRTVHARTVSARTNRTYNYYVTQTCARKGTLDAVLAAFDA